MVEPTASTKEAQEQAYSCKFELVQEQLSTFIHLRRAANYLPDNEVFEAERVEYESFLENIENIFRAMDAFEYQALLRLHEDFLK